MPQGMPVNQSQKHCHTQGKGFSGCLGIAVQLQFELNQNSPNVDIKMTDSSHSVELWSLLWNLMWEVEDLTNLV